MCRARFDENMVKQNMVKLSFLRLCFKIAFQKWQGSQYNFAPFEHLWGACEPDAEFQIYMYIIPQKTWDLHSFKSFFLVARTTKIGIKK